MNQPATREFDFNDDVIVYAAELGITERVMAILRTQSSYYKKMEELARLNQGGEIHLVQEELEKIMANNPEDERIANEIRRKFVAHLRKIGFFEK